MKISAAIALLLVQCTIALPFASGLVERHEVTTKLDSARTTQSTVPLDAHSNLPSEITVSYKRSPLDIHNLPSSIVATLGINFRTTSSGVVAALISGRQVIPTRKSHVVSTSRDNQSIMPIEVYRGDSTSTNDNNLIGKYEVKGIPPAPRGVPQIEVTFDIDANGIIKVSALDKGNGQTSEISLGVRQISI